MPDSKYLRELLRTLGSEWRVHRWTKSGHLIVVHTTGGQMTVPGTPSSDHRAIKNIISTARRVARTNA